MRFGPMSLNIMFRRGRGASINRMVHKVRAAK